MVLISNSSLTETRGTVNGYGQALCAVGRSLGPVVGAPLFAWSENTGMNTLFCPPLPPPPQVDPKITILPCSID